MIFTLQRKECSMQKTPHPFKYRLAVIALFLVVVLLFYLGVLYDTQIVHGSEYRAKSLSSNATTQSVEASRGIITDRNGKVLVSNRLTYTLIFSDDEFETQEETNQAILRLVDLCRKNKVKWEDTLPLSRKAPYQLKKKSMDANFEMFAKYEELPSDEKSDTFILRMNGQDLFTYLCKRYELDSRYSAAEKRILAGIRYELQVHDLLDSDYIFADDVSVEFISQAVDGRYAGVTTGTSSARVYDTKYAAHILGRIGPIYQEEWLGDPDNGVEGYADKGYSMNTLVGKDGVERAFEEYLHGTNGNKLITTSPSGKITGEVYVNEPRPGSTVALTLDIDLQEAVEKSLATRIEDLRRHNGEARGGAAAVVEIGSGEVLAMASYPTYDLSKFDEIYDDLVEDEKYTPLLNRATNGLYAPGSTFKPMTAVAALESGVITPETEILDRGIYDYYSSPQPRCWIYSMYGGTHGWVNVSEAITVSCNYFFYEVGRLTGIKTLDDYAAQFGLGQPTGIEIGDSAGVMASPEYAEEAGLEWTDGQTITAAIGQSYSLFTPLQMANYIATLAGDGEHYATHLLKNVKSYDNTSLVYAYDEPPKNVVKMSDSTKEAVLSGMHGLTQDSLSYVFKDCVVSAGAKTGTAEIGSNGKVNGMFVAFAPYDDPQIAVAVAIERADAGADLAPVAVDIINSYFSRSEAGDVVIGENTLIP